MILLIFFVGYAITVASANVVPFQSPTTTEVGPEWGANGTYDNDTTTAHLDTTSPTPTSDTTTGILFTTSEPETTTYYDPNGYPWLLNLERQIPVQHWETPISQKCGASLIRVPYLKDSSDIVLTAAFCITQEKNQCNGKNWALKNITIFESTLDFTQKYEDRKQIKVIGGRCHESWNEDDNTNGIALLRLEKPIAFSKTIQPVDLPKQNDEIESGTRCTLAVWDFATYDSNKNPIRSDARQLLDVTILGDDDCKPHLSGENTGLRANIRNVSVCVKADRDIYSGICKGDPGSPIICKNGNKLVQHGLVNHEWPACIPKDMGKPRYKIFADISVYIDWIEENIEK